MSARWTREEWYVRARVAATGAPCLLAPRRASYPLLAAPLWEMFAEERVGIYVLFVGTSLPGNDEKWAISARIAMHTVRKWAPRRTEGVAFIYEEGAASLVQRVEASVLGLSLLQLALNIEDSGLVIGVRP